MENKRFYIVLTVFTAVLFFLNINHLNQQLIFSNLFLDGANNLLSGDGFTNSVFHGSPAFYPMWGYTFFLLPDAVFGTGGYIALIFQLVLTITGIYYFYKIFNIEPKYIHLVFHLPLIAIMSVKWPDAVITFMFILFIYYIKEYFEKNRTKSLIITGIILGVIVNFRTEFVYLPVFLFAVLIIPGKYIHRRKVLISSIALAASVIVFISPWAIRSYVHTGKPAITTSNSGMVSYISLGSLPDNPWNIYISDITAWNYVKDRGEDNPFSAKGNKMLDEAFIESVRLQPADFLYKCAYNFARCFAGGVYTGEYANIAVDTSYRYKLNEELKTKGNSVNQLLALKDYSPEISIPIALEKVIQALYIPVNLVFILSLVFLAFKFKKIKQKELFLLIAAFIIYKLIVTSLFIYEPRFMNSVYYFALGIVLAEKSNIPIINKLKFI